MKAQKSLRIAATIAVFVASTATAQNLLQNPNFEDGPVGYGATGWDAFGNVYTEADNGVDIIPCEGDQVLKAFGGFSGVFNVGGVFQEFPAAEGQEWSFRCTARHSALDPMIGGGAPDANWMVQKIAWFDGGGIEIGGAESTILDGTFATDVCHTADAIVSVAPAGTATVQALILYLQPALDGGAGQVDEAELLNLSGLTPTLEVFPDPPVGGEQATLTVRYATPNKPTFLAYTLRGLGEKYVPQLNVTLDLKQPTQIGSMVRTDANGTASWTLPVPGVAIGRNVWLQAVQFENKTNVLATAVVEPAANLLANPNFEDGAPGIGAQDWLHFGNVFTEAGNGGEIVPCEGNQVAKLFGNFSGGFNVTGIYQEFPAAPGEEWSLTSTARHSSLDPMIGAGAPDANWIVQKLAWFDGGGVEIGGAESTILDGTLAADQCHVAAPISAVAPAGTASVQALILYLQPAVDGGPGQIDEVVLNKLAD